MMAFRQKGISWSKAFTKNPKKTTIYTPLNLSYFIFNKLKDFIPPHSFILDPCVGKGSLLQPWKDAGYKTHGIDIDPNSKANEIKDFLYYTKWTEPIPSLIICNPPFNGSFPKLAPEIWLDKLVEVFKLKEVPIPLAFFTTYQMRVCHSLESKRYQKWLNTWPEISSILCLPDNIFKPHKINSEVIFFNLPRLKPHYFLAEIILPSYDPFS